MEPFAASIILVVEDDPSIRDLLVTVLRAEGYEVVEARNGQAALDLIAQHQLADQTLGAILLDLMLPDMDGLQVQRQVREQGLSVPIITMSASPTLLGEAMRQGSHIGVGKPFDLDELLALVTTYCPRPSD